MHLARGSLGHSSVAKPIKDVNVGEVGTHTLGSVLKHRRHKARKRLSELVEEERNESLIAVLENSNNVEDLAEALAGADSESVARQRLVREGGGGIIGNLE